MRARVRVDSGSCVPGGAEAGQRMPSLLAARGLGGEESPLQSRDQVLHRSTFPLGGANHSADPPGLGLLTAPLVALERGAVGGQVGVELFTLGQQHLPEMFGLKAIRGLGRLVACVHIAR